MTKEVRCDLQEGFQSYQDSSEDVAVTKEVRNHDLKGGYQGIHGSRIYNHYI